jgi:hypothetical protein
MILLPQSADDPLDVSFHDSPVSFWTKRYVLSSIGFVLFILILLTGPVIAICWWQGVLFKSSSSSSPGIGTVVEQYLTWKDTSDVTIQAHGGGMLIDPFDGSYWWVGETEKLNDTSVRGINLYHSSDLVEWLFEGKILSLSDLPQEVNGQVPLIMERPKMIYHSVHQQYVLWLHIDNANYTLNTAGVAVSSSPTGPWILQNIFQPDGVPIKDLTVYVSESMYEAYLIYSACVSDSWVIGISVLSYTSGWTVTTGSLTSLIRQPLEAPTIWRYDDIYYIIASDQNGWGPNIEYLYRASPAGVIGPSTQWTLLSNPFIGDPLTSYGGQSTYVVQYTQPSGLVELIMMMDMWIGEQFPSQQLPNSTYVWLPINLQNASWIIPYLPQVAAPSLNNTEQIVYYDANALL